MKRPILVGATLLLIGAICGVTYATSAQTTMTSYELPQPHQWVSFSADVRVTDPLLPLEVGHYYRNSHGSTRWEIRRINDVSPVINIINVSTAMWYTYSPRAGWTSRRTDLIEAQYQPMPWTSMMPGLMRYAHKADVMKGGSGRLDAPTGLDAYVHTSSSGTLRLVIPELNFFAVSRQYLKGRSWLFTSIERGEPDASLFLPPADANVKAFDTIVSFKNQQGPLVR